MQWFQRKGRRYTVVADAPTPASPAVASETPAPIPPEEPVLSEAEELAQALENFPLTDNPFAVLAEDEDALRTAEAAEETSLAPCSCPMHPSSISLTDLLDVGRAAIVLGGLTAALVGVKASEVLIKGAFKAGSGLATRLF